MATIKAKKAKVTSKKKKTEPKIKVNTKDEWITVYTDNSSGDFNWALDHLLELANEHKPEGYSKLDYKDISIYLDKDYGDAYYDDVCVSLILEIKIKNKDYIGK